MSHGNTMPRGPVSKQVGASPPQRQNCGVGVLWGALSAVKAAVLMLGSPRSPRILSLTLIPVSKLGSVGPLSFLCSMPVSRAKSTATGYFCRTCGGQFSQTSPWVRSMLPFNLSPSFEVNSTWFSGGSQWIWIAVSGAKKSIAAENYRQWLINPSSHPEACTLGKAGHVLGPCDLKK